MRMDNCPIVQDNCLDVRLTVRTNSLVGLLLVRTEHHWAVGQVGGVTDRTSHTGLAQHHWLVS